ncbi:hypothetical protein AVEN_189823-1 [Araneus ventricosus]|uniref:Uncharacterized protein n=1 Tax=Araneus ventricosus TaxID=182803 RepID=A0A4Y2NS48_ARAVE|nr:hypothetical protein AVEN_189823-1 [Araneus ventricosus]
MGQRHITVQSTFPLSHVHPAGSVVFMASGTGTWGGVQFIAPKVYACICLSCQRFLTGDEVSLFYCSQRLFQCKRRLKHISHGQAIVLCYREHERNATHRKSL